MIAKLRQYRTSPKKVNLVACLVRKKTVTEAINTLKFTNKKSAIVLQKLIESALANAEHNFKQNKDTLYLKEVLVCEATTLKRSVPISRGRAHPILKRASNITVKLAVIEGMEAPKKTVKKTKDTKVEKLETPETKETSETTEPKKTRKSTKSK